MSATTGTWGELIFANQNSGTALASFAAESVLMGAAMTEAGTTANFINAGLPAGFFPANEGRGKVVRVVLRGVMGSAAGTATFTFGLRWTSLTGVLIATTTAITPATLATPEMWKAEVDIQCLTTGNTTTATARVTGEFMFENSAIATGTTITTPFCAGSAFGTPTPTSLTTAGFDSTVPLPIVPTCTCSASAAGNTVTLTDFKIFGLN